MQNADFPLHDREVDWRCKHKCGFAGTYAAVEAHEAVCHWRCKHKCGFAGTYAAVEAHEAVCPAAAADDLHVAGQ